MDRNLGRDLVIHTGDTSYDGSKLHRRRRQEGQLIENQVCRSRMANNTG